MAEVWRAFSLSTKQYVAVKLLPQVRLSDPKARARFEREVRLAADLKHPNIAHVHVSGLHRGGYYYVMDFIEGLCLDKYVEKKRPSRKAIVELFGPICEAVAHAHAKGFIHRDLKPSNIIVNSQGSPVVVDWGLAKALEPDPAGGDVSAFFEVGGSPAFMSPEQMKGDKQDIRMDIYALGVTLFKLLTGAYPHDLPDSFSEATRVKMETPPRLDLVEDRELRKLLAKVLARDPDDRYQNTGDLHNDLCSYLRGDTLRAGRYSLAEYVMRKARVHRKKVLTAAFMALFVLSVASYAYVRVRSERDDAVAARASEAQQHMLARRHAYASDMNRAQALWDHGSTIELDALLSNLKLPRNHEDWRSFDWFYLWGLCHQAYAVFPVQRCYAVCFSPDGHLLAASTNGRGITLWDASTGKAVTTLRAGKKGIVVDLEFSRDGSTLAVLVSSSSASGADVELWSVESGTEAVAAGRLLGSAAAIAWGADEGLLGTVTRKGLIRLWDSHTGRCRKETQLELLDDVVCLESSGSHGLFCCADRLTAVIWNSSTSKVTQCVRRVSSEVCVTAISNDGSLLAVGLGSGRAELVDIASSQVRSVLEPDDRPTAAMDLVFSSDGTYLAAAQGGEAVTIWQTLSGTPVKRIHGHLGNVYRLAMTDDASRLATIGTDGSLRLWCVDMVDDYETIGTSGHSCFVRFSQDDTSLVVGADSRTGSLWSRTPVVDDSRNPVSGRWLSISDLSLCRAGSAGRWEEVHHLGAPDWKHMVALSDRGHLIAMSRSGVITVYDVATFGLHGTQSLPVKSPVALAACPHGNIAACTDSHEGVLIWDLTRKEVIRRLGKTTVACNCMALSEDGSVLAASSSPNAVGLWSVETGSHIVCFLSRNPVTAIRCGPQNGSWAIGTQSGEVLLWSYDGTFRCLPIKAHNSPVTDIAYSPDNLTIATGSLDGTVKLWDSLLGKQRLCLSPSKNGTSTRGILSIDFNSSGTLLAVGCLGGGVRMYQAASRESVVSDVRSSKPASRRGLLDGSLLAPIPSHAQGESGGGVSNATSSQVDTFPESYPASGTRDGQVSAVCGNGIVEAGEQCDDGDLYDGDGCSRNCEATCQCCDGLDNDNDGFFDYPDDPSCRNPLDGSEWSKDQIAPFCGNGIREQGEECDDGNWVDGDGCSMNCEAEW
ncbi:MAG: protein kinase [Sedimentisphaerales bacterium]|nr:protein kinase [Sedimentisphaerales bacterium]